MAVSSGADETWNTKFQNGTSEAIPPQASRKLEEKKKNCARFPTNRVWSWSKRWQERPETWRVLCLWWKIARHEDIKPRQLCKSRLRGQRAERKRENHTWIQSLIATWGLWEKIHPESESQKILFSDNRKLIELRNRNGLAVSALLFFLCLWCNCLPYLQVLHIPGICATSANRYCKATNNYN